MGTAFMVPAGGNGNLERAAARRRHRSGLALKNNIAFLREIAIGLVIVLFLIFEPDGLAHRWRRIKAYWKLYPFSY